MDVINMDKINELRLGLETAYIDGSVASDSFYCPRFVSNNYKSGKKVLSLIEDELLRCDKFQICQKYKKLFVLAEKDFFT